jgi:hypothetical protein
MNWSGAAFSATSSSAPPFNFQSAWRPYATRVNEIRIFPAQYSDSDYSKYQNIFNGYFQSLPVGFVGSQPAFPSPMYYQTQYAFQNPVSNRFPGPDMYPV